MSIFGNQTPAPTSDEIRQTATEMRARASESGADPSSDNYVRLERAELLALMSSLKLTPVARQAALHLQWINPGVLGTLNQHLLKDFEMEALSRLYTSLKSFSAPRE